MQAPTQITTAASETGSSSHPQQTASKPIFPPQKGPNKSSAQPQPQKNEPPPTGLSEKKKQEEQLLNLSPDEQLLASSLSFMSLFRFATRSDIILMIFGTIACILNSACSPLFNLYWGEMTDSFNPYADSRQAVVDMAWSNAQAFLVLGAATFVLSWIQMGAWIVSGERQAIQCRISYFGALLRQEVGWFDMVNPNELASKVAVQANALQQAIGEKVPTFIFTIITCLFGFFIAFYRGWLHSLVATAGLPGIAFGGFVFTYFLQNMDTVNAVAYSRAGGCAEQAVAALKTVKSLGGEQHELQMYSVSLVRAWQVCVRYSVYVGLSFGSIFLLMFADYALCFWYGSVLVEDQTYNHKQDRAYTAGDVVTIFNSIMMGGFGIGQIFPCLKSFAVGKQAAFKIFQVLDRRPRIAEEVVQEEDNNLQDLHSAVPLSSNANPSAFYENNNVKSSISQKQSQPQLLSSDPNNPNPNPKSNPNPKNGTNPNPSLNNDLTGNPKPQISTEYYYNAHYRSKAGNVTTMRGEIVFENVNFSYPSKPHEKVLQNVSLRIQRNKKTSFVGESGSGKSTIMQLILRFYDPDSGAILSDGEIPLSSLKLSELRSHIGYVGQEPVLFATSIRENLRIGKQNATDTQMIAALKQANAWDFVSQLEKGLDTFVGGGGGGNQLSGGQKQRLCIARAILKDPQILLLDEATSALDRKNEKLIQRTLDVISQDRTTVYIAHRLSTVINSDYIYVLDRGQVVEQGTHASLINAGGKYEALCKNQLSNSNKGGANSINNKKEQNNKIQQQQSQQRKIGTGMKKKIPRQLDSLDNYNNDGQQEEDYDQLIFEEEGGNIAKLMEERSPTSLGNINLEDQKEEKFFSSPSSLILKQRAGNSQLQPQGDNNQCIDEDTADPQSQLQSRCVKWQQSSDALVVVEEKDEEYEDEQNNPEYDYDLEDQEDEKEEEKEKVNGSGDPNNDFKQLQQNQHQQNFVKVNENPQTLPLNDKQESLQLPKQQQPQDNLSNSSQPQPQNQQSAQSDPLQKAESSDPNPNFINPNHKSSDPNFVNPNPNPNSANPNPNPNSANPNPNSVNPNPNSANPNPNPNSANPNPNPKSNDPNPNQESAAAHYQKQKQELESQVVRKLLILNKPERGWLVLGLFAAAVNGLAFPLVAYFMSEMMSLLLSYQDPDFRAKSDLFCLWFVLIGLASLVFNALQTYFFTRTGESLTLRMRQMAFSKILRMPVAFFEDPRNSPGALSSLLAADAQLVNQLTTSIIGINFSNICAFACGLFIAFSASWQITLITFAMSPLFVISGTLQAQFMQGYTGAVDDNYKDAAQIIMEAVTNIRTVLSFAQENFLVDLLSRKMDKPRQILAKKGHLAGISFGFSQLVMFVLFAVVFYVGAVFYRDGDVEILEMFTAIYAIMYAAIAAGNANMFMADVGRAKNAAINLFVVLDSQDEVQLNKGTITIEKAEGNIEFKNVCFKYPSRDKIVLQNLSFSIKSGQKIAFVGASGCGKSTIFQLLLRFYEPDSGEILLDGENIKNYELKSLRKVFGVVSQEPTLFNCSIKENIQYNYRSSDSEKGQENINNNNQDSEIMETIRKAAIQANALTFIEQNQFDGQANSLENAGGSGFDRIVGPKGQQISGGQKQRIAIARALIKQPSILLLDEATSALDTENEAIIQDSLNKIMKGKTSLCIAHRISTVKDADHIFVIETGQLVEQGTYDQLVANQSYFYRLERGDN